MRAEDWVLKHFPNAKLVERRGTFVGGKVRYEIRIGNKIVGMDTRKRSAWAEAMRYLKPAQGGPNG